MIKKQIISITLLSSIFSQIDYSTQIQPIFNNYCTSCHINGGAYFGGLDLSSYFETMEGGDNGNTVLPNDYVNSVLYQRVILDEDNYQFMPQGGSPLPQSDIELIAQWIDEGALEIPSLSSFELNFTPNNFMLYQNYPNPFNPLTTLRYDLPKNAFVRINIYDILGNIVCNLVNKNQESGYKSVQWNATNNQGEAMPAGLYFYSIKAGQFRLTKTMILLK